MYTVGQEVAIATASRTNLGWFVKSISKSGQVIVSRPWANGCANGTFDDNERKFNALGLELSHRGSMPSKSPFYRSRLRHDVEAIRLHQEKSALQRTAVEALAAVQVQVFAHASVAQMDEYVKILEVKLTEAKEAIAKIK